MHSPNLMSYFPIFVEPGAFTIVSLIANLDLKFARSKNQGYNCGYMPEYVNNIEG